MVSSWKLQKVSFRIFWHILSYYNFLYLIKVCDPSIDELLHTRPNSRNSRQNLLHMEATQTAKGAMCHQRAWVKKTRLLLKGSKSLGRTPCQVSTPLLYQFNPIHIIQTSAIIVFFALTKFIYWTFYFYFRIYTLWERAWVSPCCSESSHPASAFSRGDARPSGCSPGSGSTISSSSTCEQTL